VRKLDAAETLESHDATDTCVVTPMSMKSDMLGKPVSHLYVQKRDGLVRWAFLLTGSFEEAQDIVQNAFTSLHMNVSEVREPEAYLKQAVINGARRSMRRRYRQPVVVPASETRDDALFDGDLWNAVQALSGLKRIVVVLRYRDDLPIAAIAEYIGKSEPNTKTILHRALRTLRKELS
jgi:RNA polymerase sigma factor (sigma-70 family)